MGWTWVPRYSLTGPLVPDFTMVRSLYTDLYSECGLLVHSELGPTDLIGVVTMVFLTTSFTITTKAGLLY